MSDGATGSVPGRRDGKASPCGVYCPAESYRRSEAFEETKACEHNI